MRFRITVLSVLLLTTGLAGAAFAGAMIDWDPLYTWEPNATPTNSVAGNELQGVGIVSSFASPLGDLDPNDPATEYTIYIHGLISQGTVPTGPPSTTFYTTNYSGGVIEIYAGSPRNSVFTPNPPNADVPSTFNDGTLILSGTFNGFYTQTNNFTAFDTGNMEGNILWTGGTLYDRTITGGQPCQGLFTGGITWYPPVSIPGYIFRHDGKIDLQCPTAAEPSTWGRIKNLYN